MTTVLEVDPAAWIEDVIRGFIDQSPENTLQGPFVEKAFEHPLVGFSSGDDPLYESYRVFAVNASSAARWGRCLKTVMIR